MLRRYTFKLYPNATQAAAMENIRVMSCRLYNALVEQRRDAWDRRRVSLGKFDQSREMTILAQHPDFPEWRAFPSATRERIGERVDQAFKKYFDNVKSWRRAGSTGKPPFPPRYQKTSEFSGFGYRESPKGWRWLDGKKLRLQGVGDVKIRGRFPATPLDYRTCDLMKKDGKWTISIVVKFDDGAMRAPTPPVFGPVASNLLNKIRDVSDIRATTPEIAGKPQASRRLPRGHDRATTPEIAKKPLSRGAKNRNRRRQNTIRQRDHALHQYTSWLAHTGGNIEVERPPLREATKTARGDIKDPGAMVDFKAKANRDLLDRGIGKMCEMLAYKTAMRGNAFNVVEAVDHDALIPAAIVNLAKTSKRARRTIKKGSK